MITAGAVEVKQQVIPAADSGGPTISRVQSKQSTALAPAHSATPTHVPPVAQPVEPVPVAEPTPTEAETTPATELLDEAAGSVTGGTEGEGTETEDSHSSTGLEGAAPSGAKAGAPAGGETVVVTVGGTSPETAPAAPPAETPPPPPPPAESAPPAESPPPTPSGNGSEDEAAGGREEPAATPAP